MPTDDPADIADLADEDALVARFNVLTPRLRAMIASRLDPRARGRRDADDVLQEVYLRAHARRTAFAGSGMTPYAWFYQLTLDWIRDDHDYQHALRRDIGRERGFPDDSSAALVGQLAGPDTTPSQRVARDELQALLKSRLEAALARLTPDDRELIWKRHGDELTLAEIAQLLGASAAAVRQRYARARLRLREVWLDMHGDPEAHP